MADGLPWGLQYHLLVLSHSYLLQKVRHFLTDGLPGLPMTTMDSDVPWTAPGFHGPQ